MAEDTPEQLKASLHLPETPAPTPLKDEHVSMKRVGRPLRHVRNIPTKQLVFYSKFKAPQFTYELPLKLPVKSGHVVVQVHSVGLNPVDIKIINSYTSNYNKERGIGREFSGVITHVGDKVTEWKEGEEVCGVYFHPNGLGTLSSSIDVDTHVDILVKKPSNISFEKAGSWLITFGAAYQILEKANKVSKLDSDSNVFINGGSSSVGLMLIQILKSLYKVENICASASGSARKLVQDSGAKLAINYKMGAGLPSILKVLTTTGVYKDYDEDGNPIEVREIPATRFDLIVDCVGGYDLVAHASDYLKARSKGGQYVTLVGDVKADYTKDVYNEWNSVYVNARSVFGGAWSLNYSKFELDLKPGREWPLTGVDMLESGEVDVIIDKIYDWKEYSEALKKVRAGHCHGKVVLNVELF